MPTILQLKDKIKMKNKLRVLNRGRNLKVVILEDQPIHTHTHFFRPVSIKPGTNSI